MIDKPVHRSRSLLSAEQQDQRLQRPWLLPGLLFLQALFVGSTFNTYAATIGSFIFALLVVGLTLQSSGSRDSAAEETNARSKPNRIQNRTGRGGGEKLRPASNKQDPSTTHRPLIAYRPMATSLAVLIVATVTAAMRVLHHLSGNLNVVAMTVDSIAHAAFVIALVCWVFYPRRGHPAMLGCGLVLVLTTVSAGGVSHSINGQLVATLGTVVAFAFASDYILSGWQSDRERDRRRRSSNQHSEQHPDHSARPHGNRWDRTALPASTVSISTSRGRNPVLFTILALSILLMSTSAAGHLTAQVVPRLQLDFFDRLSQTLEAVTTNTFFGGAGYVRGSKLGSVRNHMLGAPGEVAIHAYAATTPGYLRGTVFDAYDDGSWSATTERSPYVGSDTQSIQSRLAKIEMPGTTPVQGRASEPLSRIQVRKNSDTGSFVGTIEVHNVRFKGNFVFTSLSTNWIEASYASPPYLTHHDVVETGINTLEPYILGIGSEPPREPLDPVRRKIMLRLDSQLRTAITPLTKSICDHLPTAKLKARAIENFFQENFTYSLNSTTAPVNDDPISHFLESRHPAHCEFFASAAAVMLRTQGVPTRYVTGYVLSEVSEGGKFWLARNRDAHAWVEAYDDEEQQWFPVEATVGRTYRTLSTEQSLIDDTSGSYAAYLDDTDDRTLFGKVLGWLLSFRAADTLIWIFRIAQLPLFCLVVALLWVRHRQKLRAEGDPLEHKSRQMLGRVDRLMRKLSLVRARGETLHQFADRVESTASEKPDTARFLMHAADWYRSYAAARYQGQMPTPMNSNPS